MDAEQIGLTSTHHSCQRCNGKGKTGGGFFLAGSVCLACEGSSFTLRKQSKCILCKGTSVVPVRSTFGYIFGNQENCYACESQGYITYKQYACRVCKASGTTNSIFSTVKCKACHGACYTKGAQHDCAHCSGTGFIPGYLPFFTKRFIYVLLLLNTQIYLYYYITYTTSTTSTNSFNTYY